MQLMYSHELRMLKKVRLALLNLLQDSNSMRLTNGL